MALVTDKRLAVTQTREMIRGFPLNAYESQAEDQLPTAASEALDAEQGAPSSTVSRTGQKGDNRGLKMTDKEVLASRGEVGSCLL